MRFACSGHAATVSWNESSGLWHGRVEGADPRLGILAEFEGGSYVEAFEAFKVAVADVRRESKYLSQIR